MLQRSARSRRRRSSRRPRSARAQIIEEAKVAASEEGERLIAGAKAEIEQEVSRARETLRTQVAALAVAGAEQILRREVDAKVARRSARQRAERSSKPWPSSSPSRVPTPKRRSGSRVEGNAVSQRWSDMLALLEAVVTDEDVAARIGDPNVDDRALEGLHPRLLGERLDGHGAQPRAGAGRRTAGSMLVPQIRALFEELRREHEGVLEARIISALPISDEQVQPLRRGARSANTAARSTRRSKSIPS